MAIGTLAAGIAATLSLAPALHARNLVASPKSECSWETSRTHISIVGGMLDRLLETPDRGIYVGLLNTLVARTPLRFDMEVHSDKRAQRHFRDGHYDAYMIWSNFDPPLSKVKLKISEREVYAFVREGQPVPTSIEGLEGLRVGLPFVYSFPESLTHNPAIQTMRLAEDSASNLTALTRGRVDAVLVSAEDALAFLREHPLEGITYAPDQPVFAKQTYMIFQENMGLACTAEMLGRELELMRQDGSLEAILAVD